MQNFFGRGSGIKSISVRRSPLTCNFILRTWHLLKNRPWKSRISSVVLPRFLGLTPRDLNRICMSLFSVFPVVSMRFLVCCRLTGGLTVTSDCMWITKGWGCVILREIDFLLKICWSIPCWHQSWKVHTWTHSSLACFPGLMSVWCQLVGPCSEQGQEVDVVCYLSYGADKVPSSRCYLFCHASTVFQLARFSFWLKNGLRKTNGMGLD